MQNARIIEDLEEFETKIKNILGHLSRAQSGSFDQTTKNKKSHASVPLNPGAILLCVNMWASL
jgi:hypothetical protein